MKATNSSEVFLTANDFIKLHQPVQRNRRHEDKHIGLFPCLWKQKRMIFSSVGYLTIAGMLVTSGLLAAAHFGLPGWYGGLI